ncbi:MAG: AraC family transcriptional regulator [Spirochaetota bacterium]
MDIRKINTVYKPGDKALHPWPHIIMLGCHRRGYAEAALTPHRNPGFEICYAVDGEFEWTVEGRDIRIQSGESSMTMPWEEHSGRENVIGKGHLAWLIVQPELCTKHGRLILGAWSGMLSREERDLGDALRTRTTAYLGVVPGIDALFASLYEEIALGEIGYRQRVNAVVTEMLIRAARSIVRPVSAVGTVRASVMRALDLMRSDVGRKWSIRELAGHAGLGTTAFARQVKAATRATPMDYLIKLRVERAKALLAEPGRPVTDIALDLGFASSQHFTTMFRKMTGVTPSAYRAQHRNAG